MISVFMEDKYWMVWAGFMVIGIGAGMLLGDIEKGTVAGLVFGLIAIYLMIKKKIGL